MAASGSQLKKITLAGVVGNILEWYDFAVFGYFAPLIGLKFFPSESHLASLIKAFGVFAAGYLMRPLGGVIFGHIGDRLGRKKALQVSVLMMALPTTLLGLLPTHAQIGISAAGLLMLLRLIQGVSVGGELIGSISFVTESAPPHKRGFVGSWTLFSAVGGVMLGSAVATLINFTFDPAALNAWGWRLPFLPGILVGIFGLWLRRGLVETPAFERAKQSGQLQKIPLVEALRTQWDRILQVSCLVCLLAVGFYMLFLWWPTYLAHMVRPPVGHALLVNTLATLFLMALIPLAGWLSDRVGRKKVLAASSLAMALLAYPLFVVTDFGTVAGAVSAQFVFAVIMSMPEGAMPAAMVEMFPAHTRLSGVGMGYNISLAVFGGTTPLVCTWLVHKTGVIAAPAYYLIAVSAVSLAAALLLPQAAGESRP